MDTPTIIIGLIVLIICILPFLIGSKKARLEAKNNLNRLNEFAKESNGNITQYQSWINTIIGLDQNKKILYFIRKVNGNETKIAIEMNEIKMSLVMITRSSFNSNIETVKLSLESLNKSESKIILEFYDAEFDGLTITGQLQIANEWEKKINDLLLV